MGVFSSSLLEVDGASPAPAAREADFKPVLDAALDPALTMCARMAEMRPTQWDRAVFGINCVEAVLATIEGFDFTATRVSVLEAEEEKHVESLTAEHVRFRSYPILCRADLDRCTVLAPPQRKRSRANPHLPPLQRHSRVSLRVPPELSH